MLAVVNRWTLNFFGLLGIVHLHTRQWLFIIVVTLWLHVHARSEDSQRHQANARR
jgi:hypothetical protein